MLWGGELGRLHCCSGHLAVSPSLLAFVWPAQESLDVPSLRNLVLGGRCEGVGNVRASPQCRWGPEPGVNRDSSPLRTAVSDFPARGRPWKVRGWPARPLNCA